MATPAYDGQGQPSAAQGWFSGLAAWWKALTPQYVTRASGGTTATARSATEVVNGALGGSPGPGVQSDSRVQAASGGSGSNSAPSAANP